MAPFVADFDPCELAVFVTDCGKSHRPVAISPIFVFLLAFVTTEGLMCNLAKEGSDRPFEFDDRSRRRSFANCGCVSFSLVEPAVDPEPQEGFVGDLEMGLRVVASGLCLMQGGRSAFEGPS